jgi:hypothetical protein
MMLLRLLNGQGIAGLLASLCLGGLLLVQMGEARHWHKESDRFEQLYGAEEAAHARTVADYRAAAVEAEAADRANAKRVATQQSQINERSRYDFEARLADARARYGRLQQPAQAATDPGGRANSPVSSLSAAPERIAQAAGQDGLSGPERLLATEQAIQLDELIQWVRRQAQIDPDAAPPNGP